MVLLSILPAADRPSISRITYKDKLAKQQKDKDKDKDKGRIVEFGVVHMGGELTARSNIAHNHVFQSLHNHVFAQKTRLITCWSFRLVPLSDMSSCRSEG